jgi:hypothetical protein
MAWLLVLNSLLFVATLTEYLICMKYVNMEYDYKNEWFNVLLSLIFTPFYSCFFIHKFSWSKIKSYTTRENRHLLIYPVCTGILYTIETVTVFFALNTITLSYYTILRSGFIIFNIPWFKYLLKKPITRMYVASCTCLVVAQLVSTVQYVSKYNSNGSSGTGNVIQNAIIVMVSCFINAAYNNLIEYSMALYGTQMQNIDFQIIFQFTYFVMAAPFAVFYTIRHTPPVTANTMTMYFFIAFGLQLYMFNKIYILNSSKHSAIPANILLSGLDLLRRVIQLTYSFVCFKEPFDTVIGISLIFLMLSAALLLYQYTSDHLKSISASSVKHVVLEEV